MRWGENSIITNLDELLENIYPVNIITVVAMVAGKVSDSVTANGLSVRTSEISGIILDIAKLIVYYNFVKSFDTEYFWDSNYIDFIVTEGDAQ